VRYRRPFTPEQRRDAARVYELLRSNFRTLRKAFPPVGARQRAMLSAYRDHVYAVGSELLKVDALVNVDELNRLIQAAVAAMTHYFRQWHSSGGDE
jgi:hypothetical protein